MDRDLWIFGYGSLLWRPDFAFAESCAGYVCGWSRRFWQASTDHRGVPAAPGRVVTLASDPAGRCWGLAFRVEQAFREPVLAKLDQRESGGFDRLTVEVVLRGHARAAVDAVSYVASPGNPNYLGPAETSAIVLQVRQAQGPSGSNAEYAELLAASLRALGVADDHVFEVADGLGHRPRVQSPAR